MLYLKGVERLEFIFQLCPTLFCVKVSHNNACAAPSSLAQHKGNDLYTQNRSPLPSLLPHNSVFGVDSENRTYPSNTENSVMYQTVGRKNFEYMPKYLSQ